MRMFKWLAAVMAVPSTGFCLLWICTPIIRGHGQFDQLVIIDSPQPVRRVLYCDAKLDDDTRWRAENEANIRMIGPDDDIDFRADRRKIMFDGYKAAVTDNRFTARIYFATRSRFLRNDLVCHPPHLVVYAEFADGSRACRVVDIPPGNQHAPFVVRMP